jgi:ABC-type antimicrobial peptide transport system permease subunit
LTDWLAGSSRYRAVIAGLFAVFAVIAVLLACLGLYASVTHDVQTRTREIGIRAVLGATSSQILSLVLKDAGVALGTGAAAGVAVWLVSGLFLRAAVGEWSPGIADVVIAAVGLCVAALCGCLLPARRALALDPGETLRVE